MLTFWESVPTSETDRKLHSYPALVSGGTFNIREKGKTPSLGIQIRWHEDLSRGVRVEKLFATWGSYC